MQRKRYNKKQRKASRQTSFVLSLPFTPFHTLSLLLILLLSSCARQGYPTGGPKDEEAPVALGCKPDNGSRHFAKDEFYIQFDEYVVLKNPTDNILVSPPMKQQPEYTTKGKGILVKIKDTLQENTTYLFQFKEAIADFNEGNLLPSFEYVFSTGDVMDTLMLEGRVLDPRTGNPWKETVTVMAYKDIKSDVIALDDTIASYAQPDFVTRCDKEGYFAFHFIPDTVYRIVALEDKNRNLHVDASDAVAWDTTAFKAHPAPDSIQAIRQSGNQAITLYISQPEIQRQRITKSEFTAKGRIQLVSQLPMQQPSVEDLRAEWRLNSRKDTMTLWCLDAKLDSARFIVSDPSGIQDTLKLRYTEKKKKGSRHKAGEKEQKVPLMKTLCDGNKAFYDDLRLAFENPIVALRDSAQAEIKYLKDSSVTRCPIALDSTGLTARLLTTLKSGEKYHVHLRDSLFTDLYGRTSDSLDFDLTPKDYGTLTLHIENLTDLPLVIEVLDKRDTVVQSQTLNSKLLTLNFLRLPAGDYRLRAILDANGDGRWTPGDYFLNRQPEQAIFFKKTLSLREKWEMEEQWIIRKSAPMELERVPIRSLDTPKGGKKIFEPKQ